MRYLLCATLFMAGLAHAAFVPPSVDSTASPVDAHFDSQGNFVIGVTGTIVSPEVYPDAQGGYYAVIYNQAVYIAIAPDHSTRYYSRFWTTYGTLDRPPPPEVQDELPPDTWTDSDRIPTFATWQTSIIERFGNNLLGNFILNLLGNATIAIQFRTWLDENPCARPSIEKYSAISYFHIMMWRSNASTHGVDILELDPNQSGLEWWENRAVLENPDWNGDSLLNRTEIEIGRDPLAPSYVQSLIKDDDGNLIQVGDHFAWNACPDTIFADAGPDQVLEAGPGSVAQVQLDGSATTHMHTDALSFDWTSSGFGHVSGVKPVVTIPIGVYSVMMTVSNTENDMANDSLIVTVRDTLPPDFSNVPADVVLEQTSPAGTPYTVALPTATDYAAGNVTVSSDAPAVFAPGITTVTFTAADPSGNSATASMKVTVRDTVAPIFSNVPQDVVLEQASPAGTPYSVGAPTAWDASSDMIGVSSDAPAVFPAGATLVTFTATDASGNSAVASMTVTVVDTTAPVLANVPAPVSVPQSSPNGTPVALSMPTATDAADANPAITSDAPALYPLGTTLVTFTATDRAGNRSTATTTVTVTSSGPSFAVTASSNLIVPLQTATVTVSRTGSDALPLAVTYNSSVALKTATGQAVPSGSTVTMAGATLTLTATGMTSGTATVTFKNGANSASVNITVTIVSTLRGTGASAQTLSSASGTAPGNPLILALRNGSAAATFDLAWSNGSASSLARYTVTGAASMSGGFTSDAASLTFTRAGDYVITAWPDGNGNRTAEAQEQPRRLKIQVIDLQALAVISLDHLDIAIDPGATSMTVKAARNGSASFAMLAIFDPLTSSAGANVRWTIEESGRTLGGGSFSSLLTSVAINGAVGHTFQFKAYVDCNRNGVLDAGEAGRTITVKVTK